MNLVILGAPGAGKGTQALMLAKRFSLKHISTGELLRKQISMKTDIGLEVAHLIEKGHLVSDELATEILKEELPQKNFILDGYPRTINQAKILDQLVQVTNVVFVDVADEKIKQRMSGRKTCPNCSAMYHDIYNPPKVEGVCDKCGAKLVERADDKLFTVAERLRIYHELTEPIIKFYEEKGILLRVDGLLPIDEVNDRIAGLLGEFDYADNN